MMSAMTTTSSQIAGGLAIIGGGKIGEALLSGLLRGDSPRFSPADIVVVEHYPQRIEYLTARYGIEVVDQVPLVVPPTAHNRRYLEAKRTKLGHLLDAEQRDAG